ncbi:GH3 auxin-responsive promoter-domain-containing protein [Butyriboletus roseoflavus]|nr:GH3 auxin-responsive promoter-domain-containing protein [Butyriboletus roseoflavus]
MRYLQSAAGPSRPCVWRSSAHDTPPRYRIQCGGALYRDRYYPRFGRGSRSSALLGGKYRLSKLNLHQSNIFPDPERAAELRSLGRPSSQAWWCSHVWPNLRSVTAIASGSFASSIALAQWFLGPNTDIRARGYGSTEVWIGSSYNSLELNQFKPSRKSIIEFSDVNKSDSISALAQLWEVQLGKRYELVLTTRDGLWRYRLGDVVEISGFDPTDGVPIIQFVERRK